MDGATAFYEVNATIADGDVAEAWQAWILKEHIAEVVACGALRGRLIRIETAPGEPRAYCVQYEFASCAALQEYLEKHSPRLREAGRRRFPESAVTYTRRLGVVCRSPFQD